MNHKTSIRFNNPALLASARRESINAAALIRSVPEGHREAFTVAVAGKLGTFRSASSLLNKEAGRPAYQILTIGNGDAFWIIHHLPADEANVGADQPQNGVLSALPTAAEPAAAPNV